MTPEKKAVIKNHEVTVDREIGEAQVVVSVRARFRNEGTTRITTKDVLTLAEQGGAEVISVISGPTLTNSKGAAKATWTFKIPSIDPEHSTAAVLKRREKKKQKAKEEAEIETPIDAFDG